MERRDDVLHADTLAQLELVRKSIFETYIQCIDPVLIINDPSKNKRRAAETHSTNREGRLKANVDKKTLKKLARKGLKKLPGRCGTCAEICEAVCKLDGNIELNPALLERMETVVKVLVKKQTAKKTGDKRDGKVVYALCEDA